MMIQSGYDSWNSWKDEIENGVLLRVAVSSISWAPVQLQSYSQDAR